MSTRTPSRRLVIAGLASTLAMPALVRRASAAVGYIDPYAFGLKDLFDDDQSAVLQAAIDAAEEAGQDLLLPAGEFTVANLHFPGGIRIVGSARATVLVSRDGQPIGTVGDSRGFVLDGVSLHSSSTDAALILDGAEDATITNCMISGDGIGIRSYLSSATIENCRILELPDAAIHSVDSDGGLIIVGNRIQRCGNAGIRIWREEAGHDGSIVTGNIIENIDWRGGGNGQNGNGVNVYQADSVIVSDNVISDCAFTAVRVNAGRNNQIRGNTCRNSGEVAIFSEFGFSGSVIADNIIDGAATGIDITNFDTGGRLATCTGNIVRNIYPASAVNPDTRPVGIYAEAETVVANNSIENVPGIGIVAGYGTFLRNVVISDNVLYGVNIGIGASVVHDPSPGHVSITGNLVSDPLDHGIVGLEWENVVSEDLVRDAANYPHVTVAGNTVTQI
jgi:uncharacterized secreted repeat protein (TIGR03808 family)